MSRDLVSEEAELNLLEIQQYVSAQSSTGRASAYVRRILESLDVLTVFTTIGTERDDVRPVVRTFGFERRVTVAYFYDENYVYVLWRLLRGTPLGT